jgi:peptidoglycan/LPS O-acetylase OafA/YrhL
VRSLTFVGFWFALVAAFALTASLALRVPALRKRIERVEPARLRGLDGLRGLLAISVFVHHAYLTRHAALVGSWGTTGNAFVQVLGLGSVSIFFMITAFLFWSRVIARDGRIAPLALYRARIGRIFPAFAGSIIALLAVVAWQTHGVLAEPPATVAIEAARQFSLGLAAGSIVNGLPHADLIDAGVTWSLGFEVVFYALLPLLALAVRVRRSWFAMLFVAAISIAFARHLWVVAMFLPGMAAAEIAVRPRAAAWFAARGPMLVSVGIGVLIGATVAAPNALFTLEHGPKPDVWPQIVALCAIFAGVVLGGGPAILARPALRFAGTISYSVYLVHGIVLYVAARAIGAFVPLATLPLWAYVAVVVACVPIVVAVACVSYFVLEEPAMRAGSPTREAADARPVRA